MRIVLDTNVVLSALLFEEGRLPWLRRAWKAGRVRPVVDRSGIDELVRVLAYPKFALDAGEIEHLLGDYLPFVEVFTHPEGESSTKAPDCRDPNDQKFLDLALAAAVDCLVTGDRDLLDLADQVEIEILRPAELAERLEG